MSLQTDLAGALVKASDATKNDLAAVFEAYSASREGSKSDPASIVEFVRQHISSVSRAGADLANGVYSEVYANIISSAPGSGNKLFPNADAFWNATLQASSQLPADLASLAQFYGVPAGASTQLAEAIVARGEALHTPFNKEYSNHSYISHLNHFLKG